MDLYSIEQEAEDGSFAIFSAAGEALAVCRGHHALRIRMTIANLDESREADNYVAGLLDGLLVASDAGVVVEDLPKA